MTEDGAHPWDTAACGGASCGPSCFPRVDVPIVGAYTCLRFRPKQHWKGPVWSPARLSCSFESHGVPVGTCQPSASEKRGRGCPRSGHLRRGTGQSPQSISLRPHPAGEAEGPHLPQARGQGQGSGAAADSRRPSVTGRCPRPFQVAACPAGDNWVGFNHLC